jgi:hypothetical protein
MKFMQVNVLGRGEMPVNVDRISAVACLTEEPDVVKLEDGEVQPVDDHGEDLYEETAARSARRGRGGGVTRPGGPMERAPPMPQVPLAPGRRASPSVSRQDGGERTGGRA